MSRALRVPIAPLEYTRRLWLRSWVGLVAAFLYAPLLVLLIFSFNDSKRNVVWQGFTFKYYGKVFENESLWRRWNSLTIAFPATLAMSFLERSRPCVVALRFPARALTEHVALRSVVP